MSQKANDSTPPQTSKIFIPLKTKIFWGPRTKSVKDLIFIPLKN